MSMKVNSNLLTPEQVKTEYPLPYKFRRIKEQRDKEIRDIFEGKDDRFILIVGPCSADREDAVIEYMTKLGQVNEVVKDKLMIIPRVYTNKPRTTGAGYKGMLHQPDVDKEPDLSEGIVAIRKLHIHAIEASGLTCADEMLYPANLAYLDDLLSYIAVGARSVENQQHRLTSSICDVPVGMKNPTSGDLSVMINAIKAAQSSHQFIFRSQDVTSSGNDLSHVILRGAVDKHGVCHPNYHYEDLMEILSIYKNSDLANPAVIIDTNHSNSNKKYKEQIRIAKEILHSRKYNSELKKLVKGLMIESYLVEGCQPITDDRVYGKSITDPCLGWEDTKNLILDIYEHC
ncbi:MAG: 3-deoxy-7-phosphoheptulonate synthase [Bacillota bacterium]|nr:3-deoxy-7-phosphoheptulonate synthase [Bacillota bacterium]